MLAYVVGRHGLCIPVLGVLDDIADDLSNGKELCRWQAAREQLGDAYHGEKRLQRDSGFVVNAWVERQQYSSCIRQNDVFNEPAEIRFTPPRLAIRLIGGC